MRSIQIFGSALAFVGTTFAQAVSTIVTDPVTRITYSSYLSPETGIRFGIALPTNVTAPYDSIISITAPVASTWVGFCWGGTMVFNPLTVAWANGNSATISSRMAFGFSLPQAFDGSELTYMKGTTANATHWTVTARCRGCTSYQDSEGNLAVINGTGTHEFAWAQGQNAVQEPANNNSAFNVHRQTGKWIHDLNAARSPNFNSWIAANLLTPAVTTTSTTSTATSTSSKTTLTTVATPTNTAVGAIPASCSGAGSPVFQSVLASGWKATKVLGGLTNPRSMVWDTAGNLLLIQSGRGITVHGVGADGCITSTTTLVSLNSLNHGIAFSLDGKTLYASSMTQVYSWPYTASSKSVGTRATVVTGMYSGGSHLTRTLLIAPQNPNLLVVSHGSNSNIDNASINPATGRAIIKTFDLNSIPSGGYNYPSTGWVTGYGLRNEVAMTFDGNNMLWGVENSGDDLTRVVNGQSKDIHQNNPAEELNYIGDVTKENKQWFGYPTCWPVWQPSDFTDTRFNIGDSFVIAPNNTFNDASCKSQSTGPALSFQAHSAPIDSKFDSTYSNLYVTFHGSWNRSPTTGFKVVVVPFTKGSDGAYRPVAASTSGSGYSDVFWNPDVTKCAGNGPSFSSGCFRPAGLLFDSKNRLYMTSDTSSNGEVWILGKTT
ncbi:hypothetical protein B0O99DRAFT_652353 [Bisporella sp. PMI_857]|nr:hypothetical protein B0O99DRAFT_652353 [Bisporella sp. PMI_857]